ncbi:MAG: cytochrome c family protein [Rhodospirillaceae bacterium]|nr:cytochrome c family protein [Rhodospirillaceae bacterium]
MPDRLTLYTVISAFWMAFLAILGVSIIGGMIMPTSEEPLETFAYPIEALEDEVVAEDTGGATRESALPLLAAADPEKGKGVFRKCQTCHTVDQGGKNGTGPNLFAVSGAPIGGRPTGFKVSDSLAAIGGEWSYEKLDLYLENPKSLAPRGTMSFAGLKKAQERADVIAYMRTFHDSAPPLPVIEAEATAEAPAEMPADAAAPAEAAPAEAAPADAAPAEAPTDAKPE